MSLGKSVNIPPLMNAINFQVKRDLALGQLHCNDNTAALMASYIVQGIIFLGILIRVLMNI